MSDTLLTAVRARVVIDVDSMDPSTASTYNSTASFSDMTSDQALAYSESLRPQRAPVLTSAIDSAQGDVDSALDLFTVLLAKNMMPHITGRVHAQVTPSAAYDTEMTVGHARRLVTFFAENSVPKDRVCIKIPATPESILACAALEKEGIRTLATCVFSLPQAVAAAQAGCVYVAPFFNELAVHFAPGLWKGYLDPARDHPMAAVIRSIVSTLREMGTTLVMPTSIVTPQEVIALVSLKPEHLALSAAVLSQLASSPAAGTPLAPSTSPSTSSNESTSTGTYSNTATYTNTITNSHTSLVTSTSTSTNTSTSTVTNTITVTNPDPKAITDPKPDLLASSARALRDAIAADKECARRLADALRIFGEKEDALKEVVRAQMESKAVAGRSE